MFLKLGNLLINTDTITKVLIGPDLVQVYQAGGVDPLVFNGDLAEIIRRVFEDTSGRAMAHVVDATLENSGNPR